MTIGPSLPTDYVKRYPLPKKSDLWQKVFIAALIVAALVAGVIIVASNL